MRYPSLILLLCWSLCSVAQTAPGKSSQSFLPFGKPMAITHVTVLNVKKMTLEIDQTIVLDHGTILAVGSAHKVRIPEDAVTIDGTGKFVMPGMTDAHIHFFQSGGLYTRPDGLNLNKYYPYEKDQQWVKDNLDDLMARYLACGITTVIDVGGPFSNYTVRDSVNSNLMAPEALVTGPLISTYLPPNLDEKDPPIIQVNTPEEARELVKKQLPYKPDFIKIWYIVLKGQDAAKTLPIVQAAIEESHAHQLKVCVHATEYKTAKLAVEAGADILVHSVDDEPLDTEMLRLLKKKNILYIPTLTVMQNYYRTYTQQFNFTNYELKYANPFMLGSLTDLQHLDKPPLDYKKLRNVLSIPAAADTMMWNNLKKAQDAGILIAAGTDAGNIGTQHAASLYPELLAMKHSGLSNWEVLQAATLNAAVGFGHGDEFGSIDKGKVANLLILTENPVADLSALEHIETVIHRGTALPVGELLPVSPELLVQQQLNAYNLGNIDAFLEPYSDSVEIRLINGRLLGKGKESMRPQYESMFKKYPALHCELANRMVIGNTVIDHEKVTGAGSPIEAAAIYTIKNNKIIAVKFIDP